MIKIRSNVFETNSSSTHSITMCMGDTFLKWMNGELLFNRYTSEFLSVDDVLASIAKEYSESSANALAEMRSDEKEFLYNLMDYDWYSYTNWQEEIYYEHFTDTYKTPSGDTVYAFGYYGSDC